MLKPLVDSLKGCQTLCCFCCNRLAQLSRREKKMLFHDGPMWSEMQGGAAPSPALPKCHGCTEMNGTSSALVQMLMILTGLWKGLPSWLWNALSCINELVLEIRCPGKAAQQGGGKPKDRSLAQTQSMSLCVWWCRAVILLPSLWKNRPSAESWPILRTFWQSAERA